MVKTIRRKVKILTQDLDKNVRLAFYVLLALILWIITGLFVDRPEIEDERYKEVTRTVAVQPITAEDFTQKVRMTGRSIAESVANVSARTEGLVEKIYIKQGQTVQKGDPLLKMDVASRKTSLESAKAKVAEAESLYEVALKLNADGFQSDTAVASRKAALESAKHALDSIEKDILYTQMQAPISGYVDARYISEGDYIKIGAATFDIVSKDAFLIVAHLPQKERNLVQKGMKAQAKLINGQMVEGIVRFVAISADKVTKTYRTEILIDGKEYQIPVGMTADVTIPVLTTTAHNIPQSALVLNDEGVVGIKYVDDQNIVHFKEVKSLSNDLGGLWVTGLPQTVNLIRLGQSDVKIGEKVKAKIITKEREEEILQETEIEHSPTENKK